MKGDKRTTIPSKKQKIKLPKEEVEAESAGDPMMEKKQKQQRQIFSTSTDHSSTKPTSLGDVSSAALTSAPESVGPVSPSTMTNYNHSRQPTTTTNTVPLVSATMGKKRRFQRRNSKTAAMIHVDSWNHISAPDQQETTQADSPAPATFPQRLMAMLSDESISDIIQWLPHGLSFRVWDQIRFASQVMPQYFSNSTKYTSFTRKLNRWGFIRITQGLEMGAYYHKLFQRDNPKLCQTMRTSAADAYQQKISSSSSSSEPMNPTALNLTTPDMASRGFSVGPVVSSSSIAVTGGIKEEKSSKTTTVGTATPTARASFIKEPNTDDDGTNVTLSSVAVGGNDLQASPVGTASGEGVVAKRDVLPTRISSVLPKAAPSIITPPVGAGSTQKKQRKNRSLEGEAPNSLLHSSIPLEAEAGRKIQDNKQDNVVPPKSISFPDFQPQHLTRADAISSIEGSGSSNTAVEKDVIVQLLTRKRRRQRQDEGNPLIMYTTPPDNGNSCISSSPNEGTEGEEEQIEEEFVDSLLVVQEELQKMEQHAQDNSTPWLPPEPPDYSSSLSERRSRSKLSRTQNGDKKTQQQSKGKPPRQRRVQDKDDPLIMFTPSGSVCSSSSDDDSFIDQATKQEEEEEQVDTLLLAQHELQLMIGSTTPGSRSRLLNDASNNHH